MPRLIVTDPRDPAGEAEIPVHFAILSHGEEPHGYGRDFDPGCGPEIELHFRVKKNMPRIGGFRSFHTARRIIQGFEAMLWLHKGFGFSGAWTVREQNRLLAVCFGLQKVNEA